MNKKFFRGQKAFTLVELLVVIAIIGILAGMVTIGMSSATDRAKIAKSQGFASSLRTALMGNRIAEWNLDENGGTSVRDVAGGYNATTTNGPVWKSGSSCVSGSCLDFNGSNNYVQGPDDPSLRIIGDLTLSFWVKPDVAANNFMPVVTKEYAREWLVAVDVRGTTRAIAWRHGDGTVEMATFNNVFTDGEVWYHIACSRREFPKEITCYKNGSKLGTLSYAKTVAAGTNPLTIGSGYSYYYNGLIDEVRIYDAVLSSSAVRSEYLAGLDNLLARGNISEAEYMQKIGPAYASVAD